MKKDMVDEIERRARSMRLSTAAYCKIILEQWGESGQTIMHCHAHLIPRRKGDIDDPTGGVRGVIPEKRYY